MAATPPNMKMTGTRLSRAQEAKLDKLARAAGTTRSVILRRLVDGATDVTRPTSGARPVDGDEALRLLSERARNGSTAAITSILNHHRAVRELERLRALTTDDGEAAA